MLGGRVSPVPPIIAAPGVVTLSILFTYLVNRSMTFVMTSPFKCLIVDIVIVWFDYRHRIDKNIYIPYKPTNPSRSRKQHGSEASDHCQKGAPQDGGLPELIVAWSCLTNYSEAASLWLVTPKQDVVANHQWRHWRVICCNVEYINFVIQNLRPSNIKVIFQRPSCGSHARTVVRECCKGDDESQWERGKFDPRHPKTP